MIAKPTIPTLVAIVYGGYEFFMLGFDSKHYLQTYVLVFGGMVSIACVILYVETMRRERRRNFGRMLCALAGFIPYFFSLYLFGYMGLYRLWSLLTEFSIGGLLFGLFWALIGYCLLYTFWTITEISVATDRR